MQTPSGWLPWDGHPAHLQPTGAYENCPESLEVVVVDEEDLSEIPGEFTVYVGYRSTEVDATTEEDDVIVYNGRNSLRFSVNE